MGKVSCTAFGRVQATRASSCRFEAQLSCMSPLLRGRVACCCCKVIIVSLEGKQAGSATAGPTKLDSANAFAQRIQMQARPAGSSRRSAAPRRQPLGQWSSARPSCCVPGTMYCRAGRGNIPCDVLCSLQSCREWDAATGANSDVWNLWNRFHFRRQQASASAGRRGSCQAIPAPSNVSDGAGARRCESAGKGSAANTRRRKQQRGKRV